MGIHGQQDETNKSPESMDGRPSSASLGPASMALLQKATAPPPGALELSMQRILSFVEHLGAFSVLSVRTARTLFTPPFEFRAIIYQLESVGVRSVSIASVTSVFIGMVMAVQFAISLEKFGAMEYTGRVVGLSFTRELAPTLTAVIVGGRVGAGMAAEVGSMAVTEQIDAIRALGADPIKKLVLPRVIALIFGMPVLAMLALVFGFTGAMAVTSAQFNIPSEFFLRSAIDSVGMNDFLSGICKAPVFGGIIALVGCYFGLTTTGGTEGVGRATTRTVVVVSISILIADFFLTKLYFIVFG